MEKQPRQLTEERKALGRMIYRLLIALCVSVVVVCFTPFLWKMLSPFVICVPIAAMLQPVVRFEMRRFHMKHFVACVIPVLFLLFLFIGLVYWFASFGMNKLDDFIKDAPTLIPQMAASIRNGFEELIANFDSISPDTVTWLRNAMDQGISWLSTEAFTLGGQAVVFLGNLAAKIPDAFIWINFFFVALYLITKEYPGIRAKLPGGRERDPNSNASQLTKAGISGALGYLRVQTTYAIVSITAGWIYFSLFNFQYAWLIAIVAAILEFLPLFGNGTIYIPWSIAAFILGNPRVGTIVIALYIILTTFRRITEPKIMSHNIGVSPLASLIGMYIGLRLGGILGLIGGPIVMTILGAVFRGHYLNGIRKDSRTLINFFYRRWDWPEVKPFVPRSAEQAVAARKKKSLFGKKKK